MTDDSDDGYERAEAMEMAQDRADEERAEMQTLLDAKDRRIAELEACGAVKDALVRELDSDLASVRNTCAVQLARCVNLERNLTEATRRISDLELRLSIATELNVNDRKLIASLESQLAASRDIIRHFEQERDSWPAAYRERAKRTDARIERLQAGLATIRADLLSLKAHNNGASPATCERIMQKVNKLLHSEET